MAENSYIDTQGMSLPSDLPVGSPTHKVEYKPAPFKKLNVFTDLERKELKQIIHEVLDEREERFHKESNEWLYRGTY